MGAWSLGRASGGTTGKLTALLSWSIEYPAGAHDRYDGTVLRPGFADRIPRHIRPTARSALFASIALSVCSLTCSSRQI
jgi:hypothetical protein